MKVDRAIRWISLLMATISMGKALYELLSRASDNILIRINAMVQVFIALGLLFLFLYLTAHTEDTL